MSQCLEVELGGKLGRSEEGPLVVRGHWRVAEQGVSNLFEWREIALSPSPVDGMEFIPTDQPVNMTGNFGFGSMSMAETLELVFKEQTPKRDTRGRRRHGSSSSSSSNNNNNNTTTTTRSSVVNSRRRPRNGKGHLISFAGASSSSTSSSSSSSASSSAADSLNCVYSVFGHGRNDIGPFQITGMLTIVGNSRTVALVKQYSVSGSVSSATPFVRVRNGSQRWIQLFSSVDSVQQQQQQQMLLQPPNMQHYSHLQQTQPFFPQAVVGDSSYSPDTVSRSHKRCYSTFVESDRSERTRLQAQHWRRRQVLRTHHLSGASVRLPRPEILGLHRQVNGSLQVQWELLMVPTGGHGYTIFKDVEVDLSVHDMLRDSSEPVVQRTYAASELASVCLSSVTVCMAHNIGELAAGKYQVRVEVRPQHEDAHLKFDGACTSVGAVRDILVESKPEVGDLMVQLYNLPVIKSIANRKKRKETVDIDAGDDRKCDHDHEHDTNKKDKRCFGVVSWSTKRGDGVLTVQVYAEMRTNNSTEWSPFFVDEVRKRGDVNLVLNNVPAEAEAIRVSLTPVSDNFGSLVGPSVSSKNLGVNELCAQSCTDCVICGEAMHVSAINTNKFDVDSKRASAVAPSGCTHLFHAGCLLRWAGKKQTCPLCCAPFGGISRPEAHAAQASRLPICAAKEDISNNDIYPTLQANTRAVSVPHMMVNPNSSSISSQSLLSIPETSNLSALVQRAFSGPSLSLPPLSQHQIEHQAQMSQIRHHLGVGDVLIPEPSAAVDPMFFDIIQNTLLDS